MWKDQNFNLWHKLQITSPCFTSLHKGLLLRNYFLHQHWVLVLDINPRLSNCPIWIAREIWLLHGLKLLLHSQTTLGRSLCPTCQTSERYHANHSKEGCGKSSEKLNFELRFFVTHIVNLEFEQIEYYIQVTKGHRPRPCFVKRWLDFCKIKLSTAN